LGNRHVVGAQIASRNQYARAMNDDQSLSGGVVMAGNKLTVIATGAPNGQFDADGKPLIQAGTGNLNLAAATPKGGTGSTVLLANNWRQPACA
jgi:filamentous hemagglutinin